MCVCNVHVHVCVTVRLIVCVAVSVCLSLSLSLSLCVCVCLHVCVCTCVCCLTSDDKRLLLSGRMFADAAEYTRPHTDGDADSSQKTNYTEHYTNNGSSWYCGRFKILYMQILPNQQATTQFLT